MEGVPNVEQLLHNNAALQAQVEQLNAQLAANRIEGHGRGLGILQKGLKMPSFSGENTRGDRYFLAFLEEYEEYLTLVFPQATDSEKKSYLYWALTGEAKLQAKSLKGEIANALTTFEHFKSKLIDVFCPPIGSSMAYEEYKARKQGENETLDSYINHKESLYRHYLGPEADSPVATQSFIRDATSLLVNDALRYQLMIGDYTSIKSFKDGVLTLGANLARIARAGLKQPTNVSQAGLDAGLLRKSMGSQEPMELSALKTGGRGGGTSASCFRCGGPHFKRDCTVRPAARSGPTGSGGGQSGGGGRKGPGAGSGGQQRACHRCGRTSHLIKDCRARQHRDGTQLPQGGGKKGSGGPGGQKGAGSAGGSRTAPGSQRRIQEINMEDSEGVESINMSSSPFLGLWGEEASPQ